MSENTTLPSAGHVYEEIYSDDLAFRLDFKSDKEMTFVGIAGQYKGYTDTVAINVTYIRPNVFFISWQEKTKNVIVKVHDYENGVAYAVAVLGDGSMTYLPMKATLKKIK